MRFPLILGEILFHEPPGLGIQRTGRVRIYKQTVDREDDMPQGELGFPVPLQRVDTYRPGGGIDVRVEDLGFEVCCRSGLRVRVRDGEVEGVDALGEGCAFGTGEQDP
jgi:hypothetical protein